MTLGHRLWYASEALDRASHYRCAPDWLAEALRRPGSRVLPVWRGQSFIAASAEPMAGALSAAEAIQYIENGAAIAFLGLLDDIAHFALDLSYLEEPHDDPRLAALGRFTDLRRVGPLLDYESGALLAYARGLFYWHQRHQFCGVCGSPTESAEAGHLRRCINAACRAEHHPRTDPAVIMLVTDGDLCLLGRQAAWPRGRYSTLAGFVEPGESLEAAIAREVFEEAGVRVKNPRYHGSQPWPFPASIMLGFYAEAATTAVRVDEKELEDARWFTRDEVIAGRNKGLLMPRGDSIAARLIMDWLGIGPD